jgi:hypothetical protein
MGSSHIRVYHQFPTGRERQQNIGCIAGGLTDGGCKRCNPLGEPVTRPAICQDFGDFSDGHGKLSYRDD